MTQGGTQTEEGGKRRGQGDLARNFGALYQLEVSEKWVELLHHYCCYRNEYDL